MAPRAVLVGMPGSGKSTIGRRLAKAMKVQFVDTDAKIVETTGRSIADIFATDGEAGFRRIIFAAFRLKVRIGLGGVHERDQSLDMVRNQFPEHVQGERHATHSPLEET